MDVQNTVLNFPTLGVVTAILIALGGAFAVCYRFLRAQIAEGNAGFVKDLSDLKADNVLLRARIEKMQTEIDTMMDGKARALQCLGRALGAPDMDSAKRLVDSAISALAPSG